MEIVNVGSNVKYYDSNDVVPFSLSKISQKYFSSLTHLHLPT